MLTVGWVVGPGRAIKQIGVYYYAHRMYYVQKQNPNKYSFNDFLQSELGKSLLKSSRTAVEAFRERSHATNARARFLIRPAARMPRTSSRNVGGWLIDGCVFRCDDAIVPWLPLFSARIAIIPNANTHTQYIIRHTCI